jgi:hypothetical protein
MVASGAKVIFDQMAAPVPEIMDDSLYRYKVIAYIMYCMGA